MPARRSIVAASLTSSLLLGVAAAQGELQAESFRPEAPHGDFRVDMARLKSSGVWDEVEGSLLRAALAQAEQELGFPIGDLEDIRIWIHVPAADPEAGTRVAGARRRPQRIFAMAGDVGWPQWAAQLTDEAEIGSFATRSRGRSEVHALDEGRLLVNGDRELIESVLRGERKAGLPSADQMSLLAARDQALLHAYCDLDAMRQSSGDAGFLTETEYPEGDAPAHLMLRLVQAGDDPDDPHLQLEATVRHVKGEAGVALTEKLGRGWLAELAGKPELRSVKGLIDAVEIERRGTDLCARVDLGRTRDAVGLMAQVVVGLMFTGAQDAAQAVQLEAAAARAAALEALKRAQEAEAAARKKAAGQQGAGKEQGGR